MPYKKSAEDSSRVPMVDETNVPSDRLLKYGDITLKLGHQIARGGFSTVYKAVDDFDNRLVVKEFTPNANPLMWENEVANYQSLMHPSIVHMYGAFKLKNRCYIILEDGGIAVGRINLDSDWERLLVFILTAKGMLEGLHFMHRWGFVHTDINFANALLKMTNDQKPMCVKLCDLGLTLKAGRMKPGQHKAKWNPPPEAIDPDHFGAEAAPMDVYSTCLVLMELLYGEEVGYFTDHEIVDGAPQRLARDMAADQANPVYEGLMLGLEPRPQRRPGPLELWQHLRKLGYARLREIRR